MYLGGRGNITFMGLDERDTTSSWEDVDLGRHDLKAAVDDFEVVDSGPALEWTGDCERTGSRVSAFAVDGRSRSRAIKAAIFSVDSLSARPVWHQEIEHG